MKRPFRRFEVLSFAAALAGGAGGTPDHSVKPGAPVLTEVFIVEPGAAPVSIPAGAQACAATTATGGGCDPAGDQTCFQASSNNWCRCIKNSPPPDPPPACDGGMGGAAAGTTDAGGAGGMSGASNADAGADAAAGTAGAADAGGAADAATPAAGSWNCDAFAPTT